MEERIWHIWQHRRVERPYHVTVELYGTPYRTTVHAALHCDGFKGVADSRLEDIRAESVYGFATAIYAELSRLGATVDNTDYVHILDNIENMFAEEGITL